MLIQQTNSKNNSKYEFKHFFFCFLSMNNFYFECSLLLYNIFREVDFDDSRAKKSLEQNKEGRRKFSFDPSSILPKFYLSFKSINSSIPISKFFVLRVEK